MTATPKSPTLHAKSRRWRELKLFIVFWLVLLSALYACQKAESWMAYGPRVSPLENYVNAKHAPTLEAFRVDELTVVRRPTPKIVTLRALRLVTIEGVKSEVTLGDSEPSYAILRCKFKCEGPYIVRARIDKHEWSQSAFQQAIDEHIEALSAKAGPRAQRKAENAASWRHTVNRLKRLSIT